MPWRQQQPFFAAPCRPDRSPAMNPTAFAIMAKAPAPQGVKTRLAPALGPSQRHALALALLQDRVDQLNRLSGSDVFLAFTPDEARGVLAQLLGGRAQLIAQRGDCFGQRLFAVTEVLFARGYRRVLLIDADSALVPDRSLEAAAAALMEVDVVLGPTLDGGYYLIGQRAPCAALYQNIRYSTAAVLDQTVARAQQAQLRVQLLPTSYDVDEPRDLKRLARDLALLPAHCRDRPRRTAELLASLRDQAVFDPYDDVSAPPSQR